VNVNDAILEVMALTESELQRNRVKLQPRLSSALPLVAADRIQLQQVVLNLIVNAIESISGLADGPRELMVVAGRSESGDVFVEVRDSGPGLDPASLDHVFDTLYTTKPNGTGMGLAICRAIVEVHGGRISAAANEPKAPRFGSRCRLLTMRRPTRRHHIARSRQNSDSPVLRLRSALPCGRFERRAKAAIAAFVVLPSEAKPLRSPDDAGRKSRPVAFPA